MYGPSWRSFLGRLNLPGLLQALHPVEHPVDQRISTTADEPDGEDDDRAADAFGCAVVDLDDWFFGAHDLLAPFRIASNSGPMASQST